MLAEHHRPAFWGSSSQKLNFRGTTRLATPNNPTSLGVLEENKVTLED